MLLIQTVSEYNSLDSGKASSIGEVVIFYHMHHFNAIHYGHGRFIRLESQHGADSSLYETVVLFYYIVEIPYLSYLYAFCHTFFLLALESIQNRLDFYR